jgi:cyclophilin family peptidyl-prolyl cis-trans isomerase
MIVAVGPAHGREDPEFASEKIILTTVAGEIVLGLYPETAPGHVSRIIRYVESGVYDGTHFVHLHPGFVLQTSSSSDRLSPLEPSQAALIEPLAAEFSERRHMRGVLSMAHENDDPNSAEISFFILLDDAPQLDGNYTIFGQVLAGWDVIDEFHQVPLSVNHDPAIRLTIESARVSRDSVDHILAERRTATSIVAPSLELPIEPSIATSFYPAIDPGSRLLTSGAWPIVCVAILGLIGIPLWSWGGPVLLRDVPSLRLPLSFLLFGSLLSCIGYLLVASPRGEPELLMGLAIVMGLVAQARVTNLFERQEAYYRDEGSGASRCKNHRTDPPLPNQWLMVGLASLTMALGAANMFALQPMIGKLLAPWLGSVPAVWTTCMLFFQVTLLGGYVYAHALTQSFKIRNQAVIHGVLLMVSAVALPLSLPGFMTSRIPEEGYHTLWIFATLSLMVGAPALLLSATAPLVQAWFGATTHRFASNPYPLYVASNLGSLAGLISYPFLIEPNLSLTVQRMLWSCSWVVYALMIGGVSFVCYRNRRQRGLDAPATGAEFTTMPEPKSPTGRFGSWLPGWKWVVLSFIPSSLLLGVTNHIATDIAAMPMLWTIPLAIYLLSWTFSFTDRFGRLHGWIQRIAPLGAIVALFLWAADFHEQIRWVLAGHMLGLLWICWGMHRMLYEGRPGASKLTAFYIAIAFGGALGGIFNALIAPMIFNGFAEYPIALVASLLFLPGVRGFEASASPSRRLFALWQTLVVWALVVICTAALSRYAFLSVRYRVWDIPSIAARIGWTTDQVEKWAEFAIPLIPAFLLFGRPRLQMAATFTALLVGVSINLSTNILLRERSFFGVVTVREYRNDGLLHSLIHGGIMHGEQWFNNHEDRLEARSYYHKDGPLGDVMDILSQRKGAFSTAAIGLGTGSVAAYGQSHRPITFFEIDAAVEAIARNPKYFTYLTDAMQRGCPLEVRIGDARVTMAKSTEWFDLMVIDAFSSDSIPLHLITLEAIDGWFGRLHTDGVIAFHISNRYIDLTPVLANAAEAMGVAAFQREDILGDAAQGRGGSNWIVFTSNSDTANWFRTRPEWKPISTRPDLPVWTDDFASVLPVFRF